MKFHHVGILVRDIDKAIQEYSLLGYSPQSFITDQRRDVKICFLEGDGPLLELVCANSVDSVIARRAKGANWGPYHIGYISNDFEKDKSELELQNFIMCVPPEQAIAFDNDYVAFFASPNMGIIELIIKYRKDE